MFDAHTIRRLAVESCRDPRTVLAVIQGRASGVATASVQAAAARLGIILPALPPFAASDRPMPAAGVTFGEGPRSR